MVKYAAILKIQDYQLWRKLTANVYKMDYTDCLAHLATIVSFLQMENKLSKQIIHLFSEQIQKQAEYNYDNLSIRTLHYLLQGFR